MAIVVEKKKMDNKQRQLAIFTTASLPWLTGTAVNPLFRAAYLAKEDQKRKVTLVIPWLSLKDQHLVFPDDITFNTPAEQEKFVRDWLEARTGFTSSFTIRFYPGKFSLEKRSILALGDITVIIPNDEADIAVLEEPEHLTWYHHGKRWKKKFNLVIGVVHTNYLEYVRREKNAMEAFIVKQVNSWVISIYCNKVIRLSAATQDLPRSIICNVHGVNPKFLKIGIAKKEQQQLNNNKAAFTKSAYYIGKMIWSKGYRELLNLLSDNQKKLNGLEVDLYGSGEDSEQVQQTANKLDLTVRVHPGKDHADPLFHDYKVFLNPSTTDVVCTTTAEALAMGKIVVCANHPSNDFFKQFPNCRVYNDSDGFVEATLNALKDEPSPLTDDQRHELSWEAATQRFLKSANLDNDNDDDDDSVKSSTNTNSKPVKNLKKAQSKKLFASSSSSSLNFSKSLEDASALMHFVGTTFLNESPDEDQCKQLGLSSSSKKLSQSQSLNKP